MNTSEQPRKIKNEEHNEQTRKIKHKNSNQQKNKLPQQIQTQKIQLEDWNEEIIEPRKIELKLKQM